MSTSASGVTVEKPFYLSKKIYLLVLALVLSVLQLAFHKALGISDGDAAHYVAVAATYLVPILGTIMSIAHVDAHTRGAALLAEAMKVASTLDQPDDVVPSSPSSPAPASTP